MSRSVDDYEYCEQMLSVYEHQQKKLKNKFRKLDADRYDGSPESTLKTAISVNLACLLFDMKNFIEFSSLELAGFEFSAIFISYWIARLFDKEIIEKSMEKIDLEQLAIDYYDSVEKEKGIHAQMAMIDEKNSKIYAKRRKDEISFYD